MAIKRYYIVVTFGRNDRVYTTKLNIHFTTKSYNYCELESTINQLLADLHNNIIKSLGKDFPKELIYRIDTAMAVTVFKLYNSSMLNQPMIDYTYYEFEIGLTDYFLRFTIENRDYELTNLMQYGRETKRKGS